MTIHYFISKSYSTTWLLLRVYREKSRSWFRVQPAPLFLLRLLWSHCIDFWKIRYTLPFLKKLRCFWSLPPYHYTVICGWLDKCLHKSRETNSHLKNKPAGEKSLLFYHHDQIVHTSKPVESMRELGVSCTLTSAAAIFWFRSQLVVRTISSRSFFQKTHKSWLVLPEGTKKDLFQRWWICSGVHEGALEQLLLDNGGPSILFSAWP